MSGTEFGSGGEIGVSEKVVDDPPEFEDEEESGEELDDIEDDDFDLELEEEE